ncbi:unnamed protein product, partial [Brassica rapa subsp. narinosa]
FFFFFFFLLIYQILIYRNFTLHNKLRKKPQFYIFITNRPNG